MTVGQLAWHRPDFSQDGDGDRPPTAMFGIKAAPHVLIKVKRLFPRSDPLRNGWVLIVDTPEVARDLEWLIERYPLEMDAATAERLKAGADRHRFTEQAVQEILSGARVLDSDLFRQVSSQREHRDYQYAAADLALTTGYLLLTDELGLGKSMSGILLLRHPEALPALIVCPTHLQAQWEGEVRETFPLLRTHIIRKLQPYDPAKIRAMKGHDPEVLIIPYSKLRGWGHTLAGRVRTVIYDEAQELRKEDSQKWRAAAMVGDQARFRIGLTATPVYNYAGEIHTIFEVLAPGVLGSREEFIREWSGHLMQTIGNHHIHVRDPGALGTYLRAEGLMLRRTRKDVGRELPDVVRVTHAIESDGDVFDSLAEDAVELAELIISRAQPKELWQARGEFDWKLRQATGIAKANYVAEFVKLLLETDEQVVLFGWHRAVYEIWLERLKDHHPALYTGTESPTQKQKSRAAFLDGQARVLLMSLRAGAGLDGLQEATHVAVFGELDWSPGMHEQCIGRLQRDGQGDQVLAYFLVSENGSDPLMAEALNLKRQQSEPIQDPDAPLFAPAADHGDRVRRLAADVLERRRKRPGRGVS